jgi:hypothetical protein
LLAADWQVLSQAQGFFAAAAAQYQQYPDLSTQILDFVTAILHKKA